MPLDGSMHRLYARLSRVWPLLFAAVVLVDLMDLVTALHLGYGWQTAHGLGPLVAIPGVLLVGLILAAHVWLTLTIGLKLIVPNRTRFLLLAFGLIVVDVVELQPAGFGASTAVLADECASPAVALEHGALDRVRNVR